MSDLKLKISKNIKLVFDNEQSFIDEFANRQVVQIDGIYGFYMGSDHHLVKFEFEGIEVCEMVISNQNFDIWKSKLEEGNQS